MANLLDPRTLNVGDTLISRDFESEVRVVIEKVEFVPQVRNMGRGQTNRWVDARISGGNRLIVLTGSGTSAKDFRPDGTCSVHQTGRGLSLEVIRATK